MLLVFIFAGILGAIFSCRLRLCVRADGSKYELVLCVYIFSKICIYKTELSKSGKEKSKTMKNNYLFEEKKFIAVFIKNIKFHVEKFNLVIKIGTGDSPSTAILAGSITATIGILIKKMHFKVKRKKLKYNVIPVYLPEPTFCIKFNCIISQNMVHIIVIFFRNLKDWRCEKNGRKSSNRKAYGNSNG